jgi:putative ABC transport system permease protein
VSAANLPVLAWRQLRRDLKSGRLTVIGGAVLLAVAALSAVGFFVARVEQALARQGATLLAADRVIESPYPIADDHVVFATALGLRTARTVAFRSVVAHGERLELAEVKAVGAGYPLRGEVQTADRPYAPAMVSGGVPDPGTVWAEGRLLQALSIASADAITLGAQPLTVARVLAHEPDRGGEFFAIAPRLLMNLDDVPATGLLLPGSRATHRLLVAGDTASVEAFATGIAGRLGRHEKLLAAADARPELRVALERAGQYLGLAALTAVMLAGMAMVLAARQFAERHVDTAAILRCLGARQRLVAALFTIEMLMLGTVTSAIGCGAGYLAHMALIGLFAELPATTLPPPAIGTVLTAIGAGLIVLIGFATAPILALGRVPPLRVLRRDTGPRPPTVLAIGGLAIAAILVLAPWSSGDRRMTAYVLVCTFVTCLILAATATLVIRSLRSLRGAGGAAWRFGLAGLARRGKAGVAQITALGVALMVMLLAALTRTDLLTAWRASIPERAPNVFLINVAGGDTDRLRAFLRGRGAVAADLYPMVRGRLLAIAGRDLRPEDYADARARRLADREFNLSWAQDLQADNRIRAGRWWLAGASRPQFSVEAGIAGTLGMKLGDELRFRIGDATVAAPITSLREIDWSSFNANFFVLAVPGLLDEFQATWITSFHLPAAGKPLLNELTREFPSVTVIDIEALMSHVRGVIDRVTAAVGRVFAFTLAASLLVIFAALQTTNDERRREAAMLKTLGAQRRTILAGMAVELVAAGLVSGLLAGAGAAATSWLLAGQIFRIAYHPNPWLWPVALAAGVVAMVIAGLAGLRGTVNTPPAIALRQTT